MRFGVVLLAFALAVPSFGQAPGWLGISVKEGTERGVLVQFVDSDGPASKAGMQNGDLIVEYNRTPVLGVLQFTRLVRETPIGRKVEMKVERSGRAQTLSVTIGERRGSSGDLTIRRPGGREFTLDLPDLSDLRDRIESSIPRVHVSAWNARLGLRTDDLTPQLREFFGVPSGSGVLISSVEDDSPAKRAGLKAGDVILAVDGKSVGSAGELTRFARSAGEKAVLKIIRDKKEQEITVEIPRRQSSRNR